MQWVNVCTYSTGQELQLIFTLNVGMEKKWHSCDFNHGGDVAVRWVGLRVSETVDLLEIFIHKHPKSRV